MEITKSYLDSTSALWGQHIWLPQHNDYVCELETYKVMYTYSNAYVHSCVRNCSWSLFKVRADMQESPH